ncbi:MAG TPA: alpha/beta fold hydrolase [Gemmatimonadaceae bacterium]|nr:alpha/beta fold hydrolase [Gemmatimonadaceae bacterium]
MLRRSALRGALLLAAACFAHSAVVAQQSATLPLRQSVLDSSATPTTLTLRDVSRNDRWLGVGTRDVRWSPDGSAVYFRWNAAPRTEDDPAADPWFRVDREARAAVRVPDSLVASIPPEDVRWSRDSRVAAWASQGGVYLYDGRRPGAAPRLVVAGAQPARTVRVSADGRAVDFLMGEDLHRYDVATGSLRRMTRVVRQPADGRTEAQRWLVAQQEELLGAIREEKARERAAARHERAIAANAVQPIPLPEGAQVDEIAVSPDDAYITLSVRIPDRKRPPTLYMNYATASGYAETRQARGKVGEPRDAFRFGIVRVDPRVDPDSVSVRWLELPEAEGRPAITYGPYWNVEGTAAVIATITQDDKDLWIARLDPATGRTTIVDHQRDTAWLGGPPIQANNVRPGLIEWLPGGRLVFASERSGWSHLYLAEPDGRVRALTSGEWEVRGAQLSRDRATWLLRTSREHPADDHLYTMPAAGGALARLTTEEGRSDGVLSPDGRRVAVLYSRSDRLPDLYLRDATPDARPVRITRSGTDEYWRRRWLRPEIVTIPHPDGGVVWAGLYRPAQPDPRRPAVIYVHGGGYRQFAQRGWSVYGFSRASHYGMLNYLAQQGFTVLDFDYRGSAGYGRAYRTDIYRSMGQKDVDGAVAAARWLARAEGVDSTRIGMYGVSYGGFMTLMSLFRYPGVFAAGVSAAGVTDWAHYSDAWTSRILNLPHDDADAYRLSSPIYHAHGLADPLLIQHGLLDGNVQFQDAVRLQQRLIELEKDFEVVYYPLEEHVIAAEPALYDFQKRLTTFFRTHLLRD